MSLGIALGTCSCPSCPPTPKGKSLKVFSASSAMRMKSILSTQMLVCQKTSASLGRGTHSTSYCEVSGGTSVTSVSNSGPLGRAGCGCGLMDVRLGRNWLLTVCSQCTPWRRMLHCGFHHRRRSSCACVSIRVHRGTRVVCSDLNSRKMS